MKTIRNFCLSFFLALCASMAVQASNFDVLDAQNMDTQALTNRPVIFIFTDSVTDLRLDQQMDLLDAGYDDLKVYEVAIVTDSYLSFSNDYRSSLQPQGFTVVLVNPEGQEITRFQQTVSTATLLDFLEQNLNP